MPVPWNQRKTKPRHISLADDLWRDLGELAGQLGTDRSVIIREWAEYAVRQRRQMPQRLDRQDRAPLH